MKRIFGLLLALALCLYPALAAQESAPPVLFGKEAVLYCAETGQVLLDHNMDVPVPPASVTKLMTALLVLESGIDQSQMVTVSHDAVYTIERGSTHIALNEGEQVTVEQMLYAMLLTSANDAANVLAEAVDGTQAAFAAHMTERARQLGCRNTHFVNAHGLDDPDHYTTAYDLARITCELLKHDVFLTIAGTQHYTMPATNKQDQPRTFSSKQSLMDPDSAFYDPSVIAGKNGYTSQAGYTLVTVARRQGITLIAVTLGSTGSKDAKNRDTAALFDYGYNGFTVHTLDAGTLAQQARAAGLQPDDGALQPVTVLLQDGQGVDSLRFAASGDSLSIETGVGPPLQVEIPPAAAPTTAVQDPSDVQPSPATAKIPVSWILVGGGCVALAMAGGYFVLRLVRIHRQRTQLRKLWQHKR